MEASLASFALSPSLLTICLYSICLIYQPKWCSLPARTLLVHLLEAKRERNHFLKPLSEHNFFQWAIPGLFLFIFVFSVNLNWKNVLKVANGWIRTGVFWCRKQPRNQLCHNHCQSIFLNRIEQMNKKCPRQTNANFLKRSENELD